MRQTKYCPCLGMVWYITHKQLCFLGSALISCTHGAPSVGSRLIQNMRTMSSGASLWNTLATHVHQPNSLPLTRIACAAYIGYLVLTQGLRLHNQSLLCQHSTPIQCGSSNAGMTKDVACPSSTASPTLTTTLCQFYKYRISPINKRHQEKNPGAVGFLVIVTKREQGS